MFRSYLDGPLNCDVCVGFRHFIACVYRLHTAKQCSIRAAILRECPSHCFQANIRHPVKQSVLVLQLLWGCNSHYFRANICRANLTSKMHAPLMTVEGSRHYTACVYMPLQLSPAKQCSIRAAILRECPRILITLNWTVDFTLYDSEKPCALCTRRHNSESTILTIFKRAQFSLYQASQLNGKMIRLRQSKACFVRISPMLAWQAEGKKLFRTICFEQKMFGVVGTTKPS